MLNFINIAKDMKSVEAIKVKRIAANCLNLQHLKINDSICNIKPLNSPLVWALNKFNASYMNILHHIRDQSNHIPY
ncbi:hypothetical protein L366_03251 [Klebsiella variicola]|nr:hypothetical protein L366_03251 [Klebsiella variicola]